MSGSVHARRVGRQEHRATAKGSREVLVSESRSSKAATAVR